METFQISYILNGSGSNFKAPAFKDLDVYSGPNQSSSVSIINGNVSQSITISYIVAAQKEGNLVINPATIQADGKILESNTINIEVLKGSGGSTGAGGGQHQGTRNPSTSSDNIGENLFVKTHVSKSKVYKGEQIMLTHKVYSRYQLVDIKDIQFSDYTGFWVQDMDGQHVIQVANENINGVVYQVGEIRKSFIFPQRTGKLELKPMELQCVIRQQSKRAPRDVFEQFFGGGYEDVAVKIKSNPVEIHVLPHPEKEKPTSFSGAVGSFTFKAHLTKDKLKANNATNLEITISGKGNLKLIEPVKINFPEEFEVYDPKTSEKITTNTSGVSGSKTFDYLIIPRYSGDYTIQLNPFVFVDADKRKYITLPTPEFTISVEKGDDVAASVQGFEAKTKEEIKILGTDIRYIKTGNIKLKSTDDYFFNSRFFYSTLLVPVLAFLGFFLIYRKRAEQNKDIVSVKSKKARLLAKKHLQKAEQSLKQNNNDLFYTQVLQALSSYIQNKFNIPTSELEKEKVAELLKEKNIKEQTIQQLIAAIDACEFAKYAPAANAGKQLKVYDDALQLIVSMEEELKPA